MKLKNTYKKVKKKSLSAYNFFFSSFECSKFPPNFELVKKSYSDRFFLLFTLCMFLWGDVGVWGRFSTRITNSNFYSLTRPLSCNIFFSLSEEKDTKFSFSSLLCWLQTKRERHLNSMGKRRIKVSKICLQFSKWKFPFPPSSFSHYLN